MRFRVRPAFKQDLCDLPTVSVWGEKTDLSLTFLIFKMRFIIPPDIVEKF